MAITKNSARQCALVATCDFTYADLTSGTYAACVDLPIGAIVTDGYVAVTTLFNSATTDTFSVGSQVEGAAASNTAYSATSADITATGRAAAIVPTGAPTTAASTVGVVWTGTGAAPTAGVGRLVVEYIVNGAAESTFE